MIDLAQLLKKTSVYKTIKNDRDNGRLSHAYLVICQDSEKLSEYLRFFAKLTVCAQGSPCEVCRACKLIENDAHPDVLFYPKNGQSVLVEDINSLISESYVKPIESNKKVFIISHAQTMNLPSQNKLLKTLEEPPQNVHIIMGATSEFPLLATIKSRVKKLELSSFFYDELINALREDCLDIERLENAVRLGDGTVGKALSLYGDDNLAIALELVEDTLINMKSSANVLDFSNKICSQNVDLDEFLSALELTFRDMLVISLGRVDMSISDRAKTIMNNSTGYSSGAIINALEKITEAQERKKFNATNTMLVEWLLFQILEGKYKWQKL